MADERERLLATDFKITPAVIKAAADVLASRYIDLMAIHNSDLFREIAAEMLRASRRSD